MILAYVIQSIYNGLLLKSLKFLLILLELYAHILSQIYSFPLFAHKLDRFLGCDSIMTNYETCHQSCTPVISSFAVDQDVVSEGKCIFDEFDRGLEVWSNILIFFLE